MATPFLLIICPEPLTQTLELKIKRTDVLFDIYLINYLCKSVK